MRDIRRQLGIVIRWLPLLLVGAILSGLAAFAFASDQPKVYEASAKLMVDAGFDPDINALQVADGLASRYASAVASGDLASRVMESDELADHERNFAANFGAEAIGGAVMRLTARDSDPSRAVAVVRAVANELFALSDRRAGRQAIKEADKILALLRREIRQIQGQVTQLQNRRNPSATQIGLLRDRIAARQASIAAWLPRSSTYERNRLVYIEHPSEPDVPIEPRPTFLAMLAAVAGLLAATAIVFFVESFHDDVDDERALEAATDLSALGTLSERTGFLRRRPTDRAIMLRDPQSIEADGYRTVRVGVDSVGGNTPSLLVTGGPQADVLAVTAINLAAAYAESGRRVLLVDANLRSPLLHTIAGVSNEKGLTTLLAYKFLNPHSVSHLLAPNLRFLPSGELPPNPSEALGSRSMRELVVRLTDDADILLVASGPLADDAGSTALAGITTGTLLVVKAGTPKSTTQGMVRTLLQANVHVVGTVLFRRIRRPRRRVTRRLKVTPVAPSAAPPPATATIATPARATDQPMTKEARGILPIHLTGEVGPYWLPPTPTGASNGAETPARRRVALAAALMQRVPWSRRHEGGQVESTPAPSSPAPSTAASRAAASTPYEPGQIQLRGVVGPYSLTPPPTPSASNGAEPSALAGGPQTRDR